MEQQKLDFQQTLRDLNQQSLNQQEQIDRIFQEVDHQYSKLMLYDQGLTQFASLNVTAKLKTDQWTIVYNFLTIKDKLRFRQVSRRFYLVAQSCFIDLEQQLIQRKEDLEQQIQQETLALPELQAQEQGIVVDFQMNLSKAQLTEMKSLANPPSLILEVCQFLFKLLGPPTNKEIAWKQIQVELNNAQQFLDKLMHFDLSNIAEEQVKLLNQFEVTVPQARNVSQAAAGFTEFLQFCKMKTQIPSVKKTLEISQHKRKLQALENRLKKVHKLAQKQ